MSQVTSMALPQIGSFALLLALGLAGYSLVVGAFALINKGPGSERLGETARRAGIAAFGTVLLASVVLVTAAFTDNFSVAYIFHHSNKDLPGPYKFAVLWSGQEGSLLFWSLLLAAYGFVLRLRYKTDPTFVCVRIGCDCGSAGFLSAASEHCRSPFCHSRRDRYRLTAAD